MIARAVLPGLMVVMATAAYSQKNQVNKSDFYAAMASDNMEWVMAQEAIIHSASLHDKEAFQGALLMKKAGFAGKASQKLSLFKSGHKLLEDAIMKDGENVEFRFLRLIIQENAPKILKYKNEISADSEYIKQHFYKLKPEVQKAVIDYSKKNKSLKPSDFNQA